MATNEQKYMVDHLRDMFNGSFDDELIESILIQRDWNVDRALDDLMALTQGCIFNIPVENFSLDEENRTAESNEFANSGFERSQSGLPLADGQNFYAIDDRGSVFVSADGDDEYAKNDSEDDIIVLNQEEYCLSAGSESEEESVAAATADANPQPDAAPPKVSYADAAKPVAPAAQPVARVKPPRIMYQGYTSYEQIKRTRDSLERVKLFVKEGFKIMVLMRGCQGSGKSHLARKLIDECGIQGNYYQHVHSTDNFFCLNKKGEYLIDFEKLSEAHRWNQVNVLHVAREGLTPIVIDNTNTQVWMMSPYVKMAVQAGYEIEVMEPDTPWAFTVQELAKRNQHNVHPGSIMKTLEQYEHNVSALSLLKSFNLDYAEDKRPPRMGIRQLANSNLIAVFENIRHAIHVVASSSVEVKPTKKKPTKAEKKMARAAKKQRRRENRLKKMVEEVRRESSESEIDDSNDSCICDGDAETIKAFLSTDLTEKDVDLGSQEDDDDSSEDSWTTVDTHDDYDDNNSSDNEDESTSVVDSSTSSSSSGEASATPDNQSTPKSSAQKAVQLSDSKKKARKARNSGENTDPATGDLQNSEAMTSEPKAAGKLEFSDQLYDALAKNGPRPRLKCFENLRSGDESSSEHSKDSTFENISRKLDELDLEAAGLEEFHQMDDELERPGELLVDMNEQHATSPLATDDSLLYIVDGELVKTGETNCEIPADPVQYSSDLMENDDILLNSEVAELTACIAGTKNDPPKCEWVGLENCVNLPSNVRIEKSVEVLDLLPASLEKSTNLCDPVKEHSDQSLKIRDVIPSCLMNEVIESSADVSLDEQLKETVSTPTVKTWTTDLWLHDAPQEPSKNTNLSAFVTNDDSTSLFDNVENVDNVVIDVKLEETNSMAVDSDKPAHEVVDILENVEEVRPDLQEESKLTTANEISGDISVESANDVDVLVHEKVEDTNPTPEVKNDLPESTLTDSKIVSDVPPIAPIKGTSLTNAIKNWLSSNPLNEVKNNAGILAFNETPRKTSFSSAIMNWVSGSSPNEVKSNEDVPDGPSAAANSMAPAAMFENQCKPSNSPGSKNLTDDSPSKLKLESKSPIRVIKNKLCNVETEICNEADILQTVLRQEMQNKKRNDNGVNVDDVNMVNKFDRDAEGAGAVGTNVVKNIFDGPYEDVNLFGEWNQVEKNQAEHLAVENEADSDHSDGSNSSSSDELRTMTDVHNSANRFVNNDINRDAVVERKKPDVNHEAGNRQLKKSNMASSTLAESIDSSTPELNTLKERILINSLDKVFGQNNLELDVAAAPVDLGADSKLTNKSSLSSDFQMIENKLHTEVAGHEEAASMLESGTTDEADISFWMQRIRREGWDEKQVIEASPADTAMVESKPPRRIRDSPPTAVAKSNLKNSDSDSSADEPDASFWIQWIRGEGWDEKQVIEAAPADTVESKPPRRIRDSPPTAAAKSNLKNSDSGSCWLVNDIKSCIDLEKNHQKLPKTSNFLSSGDPFLQAKELREFMDVHKTAATVKLQNRSPNYDFLDERTDESKNLQRLSTEFSDVFLSGVRKHSDAETTVSSKWDHSTGGELKSSNFTADSVVRTSPNRKQQQDAQLRESPTALTIGKAVNNVDELSRWKFSDLTDYSKSSSNYWPKSTVKAVPVLEKELSLDESKFERKQKPSDFGNFFIPPEVLHLSQNKATNTGASDVNGYDRHLMGRCREINGRRSGEDDLSPIEAHYMSDKSTMTEGNAYTVKAKPQREDLSNIFSHEMADAILDLYDKCNGNMDWIIEILMEDGYSPSDDQLEYLSSLQNVVEYRMPVDEGATKEKVPAKKKKNRWRNRHRDNDSKRNSASALREMFQPKPNVAPDNVAKDFVSTSEQPVNSTQPQVTTELWEDFTKPKEENALGTTMYEDMFDESTESVDLFIDWPTASQLVEYFGNPTVYPIQDYQPVIKLPVSLARHLHAHLIGSVIDQAEKNENLMDQLNFELNAEPDVETNSHELTPIDLADLESSFPDYLVDEKITNQFLEENGISDCTPEAEPVVRSEDSFASKFSLNLLRKAFPTMDSSFVKDTFRSQNFNYFKTKSILSQYKDEIPVVNLEEAPTVDAMGAELDEDDFKYNEIQLFDSSVIKSSSRKEILSQVQAFRDEATNYSVQWKKCHEKLKLLLRDKKFGVASHCRQVMEEFKKKYEGCNAQAASLLITSCCFQNDNIIDLHFFKVVEALRALDIFLDHHITRLASSGRQKEVLYVITGRGSRSVDGVSHLQPPIKHRLKQRNIEFCIERTNAGLVKAVIRKTSVLSQDL